MRARAKRSAPVKRHTACRHKHYTLLMRNGQQAVGWCDAAVAVCSNCAARGVRSLGQSLSYEAEELRAAEIVQDATAEGIEATAYWTMDPRERSGWLHHSIGDGPAPDEAAGWLARQIYPHDAQHLEHDVGIEGWSRSLTARVCRTHAVALHCTAEGCAAFRLGPLPEEWLASDEGDLLCPHHKYRSVWFEQEAAGLFVPPVVPQWFVGGAHLEAEDPPSDTEEAAA